MLKIVDAVEREREREKNLEKLHFFVMQKNYKIE